LQTDTQVADGIAASLASVLATFAAKLADLAIDPILVTEQLRDITVVLSDEAEDWCHILLDSHLTGEHDELRCESFWIEDAHCKVVSACDVKNKLVQRAGETVGRIVMREAADSLKQKEDLPVFTPITMDTAWEAFRLMLPTVGTIDIVAHSDAFASTMYSANLCRKLEVRHDRSAAGSTTAKVSSVQCS
jgi:hypothetical protein